ncbi:MAG: TldD/PmbA family protein [Defluviitaleaceae bacterium]|nr:TldD/PmbA family protein [Defluviitaleaceae bacterium]MCL2240848.1 TldD/PmbA family protein [Defluviitaleaceae bacterium]
MLDKQLVYDVLTAALSTGGDLAEIFMENTVRDSITMTNGLIEKANWGMDYGLGLRIITGTNAVYAYTNNTSRASLLKLATDAAQAVKASLRGEINIKGVITLDRSERLRYADTMVIPPEKVAKKDIVERLRAASKAAYAYDALITQTSNAYSAVVQDVFIANSNGLWAEDRRVNTRVFIQSVASQGNEKQTGSESPGAKCGYEFVDSLDMEALGKKSATVAVTMLKADYAPSGKMPVIIDNAFGGVIFHEACAHSLEATGVAKGASVFCGKMGEKIAADCVNAVDDGTLSGEWGSLNIDDEGGKPRRTTLIENGVLKSYLVDYLNGLKMNMPSTGSGRRQNYRFAPTSRMTNTYILSGPDKVEEIIADTPDALYAKQMGGGSVDPASGEFNFAVLEGYMIRGGKIAEPVRGATLIGKGHEVLMNIDRVADNFAAAQGMCGSLSGAVPTNVGQPMIRVKEMIVGGRN